MTKKYKGLLGILAAVPLVILGVAILPGLIGAQAALTAPEIIFPDNGDVLTTAQFDEVDWTNATGGTPPYQYRYQSFSGAGYTNMLFSSAWMSASEISTAGTPEGDYYLRVRARDSDDPRMVSAWSNGAGDVHKVTIDNDGNDPANTSDVTLCKVDEDNEPLSGWTLRLNDGTTATAPDRSGVTGSNGCVTFEDIPYGPREVLEDMKSGWQYVSGQGDVTVNDPTETFIVKNRQIDDDDDDVVLPVTKDDCKQGGWMGFSIPFRNQGLCVSSVNHGLFSGFNTNVNSGFMPTQNSSWGGMASWNSNPGFMMNTNTSWYGGNYGGMIKMNGAVSGWNHR